VRTNWWIAALSIVLLIVVIVGTLGFIAQRGYIETLRDEIAELIPEGAGTPVPSPTSVPATRPAVQAPAETATPLPVFCSGSLDGSAYRLLEGEGITIGDTIIMCTEKGIEFIPLSPAPAAGNSGSPAVQAGSGFAGQPEVTAASQPQAVVSDQPVMAAAAVPVAQAASADPSVVETDGGNPGFSGFPSAVTPYRVADGGVTHEQTTSIPGTQFVLGDPGVISADRLEDCEGNASCVVINPNTQSLLETESSTLLCPEGGYILGFAATVTMSTADWEVTLPRQEERSWGFALRCTNGAPGDHNLPISFSGYDPGAILVTRFPVEVDAGAFLSAEYVQQNVDNAHQSENCGGGSDGCDTVSLFALDVNDGAWVNLDHTINNGWKLQSTNVQ